VFRRRKTLLTAAELNGLIVIFMRLDANLARIAVEVAGDENGE
jgi:hypothetical protein